MSLLLTSIRRALIGWAAVGLIAAVPAGAQYPAENVSLYSRISLAEFGATAAKDCWGYVSNTGREYAIVCLSTGTSFVEISDPARAVIVGHVPHPIESKDVKVYRNYVYASTDSGPLQIIDVAEIDNGVVTLVNTLARGTHNIAVNADSGYLYLCGGGSMTALDLADPLQPVEVGTWAGETHDAQVISYVAGPYAGREIAFVFAGWSQTLDIVDVTDKSNMFLVSRSSYAGSGYTHQGSLSDDRRLLFMDDELDEINGTTPSTRTLVWDVSDLSAPLLINEFTNGLAATDHNLFFRDGFLFEANYKSGLRIWDVRDPLQPVETGYFDTYPANNSSGYGVGAWSTYAFFPSGTVIVSDRGDGLFVLDVSAAVGGRRGDLNCDGTFNGGDIDPFFLALGDPAAYALAFPNCDPLLGDMNGDGRLDGGDIDPFFACLAGGGCR